MATYNIYICTLTCLGVARSLSAGVTSPGATLSETSGQHQPRLHGDSATVHHCGRFAWQT